MRRKAQILHRRPDLQLVEIRGNVETRLRKLTELDLDGLILAEAGLVRLGLESEITERLSPEWMLPAVGQGALAVECRSEDAELIERLAQLDDLATRQTVLAERAVLNELGGGCQIPLGAIGVVENGNLFLWAALVSPDGRTRVADSRAGQMNQATKLGQELAARILQAGGKEILRASGV
jgi:hydroxymethylbilane synthase